MSVHRLLCITESKNLHMFKENKFYSATEKGTYTDPVLVINDGVFEIELTLNTKTCSWMNPKEDVQFLYIGEAEHY